MFRKRQYSLFRPLSFVVLLFISVKNIFHWYGWIVFSILVFLFSIQQIQLEQSKILKYFIWVVFENNAITSLSSLGQRKHFACTIILHRKKNHANPKFVNIYLHTQHVMYFPQKLNETLKVNNKLYVQITIIYLLLYRFLWLSIAQYTHTRALMYKHAASIKTISL